MQPSPPLRLPQSLSPPSAVLSLLLPPLGLPAHRLAAMLATSDTLTATSAAALCPSSTWSYLCCGAVFDTRGTSPSSPLTQPPSPTPPSPLPATLPFSLPQPSSSPLLATVTPPATATPAAQLRCLQYHIIAICACRSAASPSLANVPSPLNALPLLDPASQPLFPVTSPYIINPGRHYIFHVVAQPLLSSA